MFVSPFERPNDVTPPFGHLTQPFDRDLPGAARAASSDAISRMLPPWLHAGNAADQTSSAGGFALYGAGGLLGMLSQLLQQFATLFARFASSGSPGDDERYFGTANGASTGDPHLSFNGNQWDSMTSHADLLDSDSIAGGFRLSTDVTTPNANGVTYNREATVTTNDGTTSVSLDNAGNAFLTDDDRRIALAKGSTLDLGNGETVTRNQDGSLQIADVGENGGRITTTMSANGTGVDVSVSAQNVDLGGDLAAHRSEHGFQRLT